MLSCKFHMAWKQSQVPGSTVITNDEGLTNAEVSETVFKEASNELLVLGELPLYFTQSVSWRNFANAWSLQTSFKTDCNQGHCPDVCEKEEGSE